MDKYKKLVDLLRGLAPEAPLPLFPAEVKAVTGDTCTVMFGDLELTDVRLKVTIGTGNNSLMLLPKIGSMVLLGSLTGDFKDLAVLRVEQMEKLLYSQDGLNIIADTTDGRVSISNAQVSFAGLFQQLANLLKAFEVLTGTGPSSGLVPTTLAAVNQFETDFKMLLK